MTPYIILIFFLCIVIGFPVEASEFNVVTEKKLLLLEPETRKKARELLRRAKVKFPMHKIIVAETWRSCQRQEILYKEGKDTTNAKAGQSWHNWGRALDIYFVTGSSKKRRILRYKEAPYLELGELAEDLGFVWGGRFRMVDAGHFECRNGLKIRDMVADKKEIERWLK